MSHYDHSNRREYDEDFKRRAVEMTLSGRGPTDVARDLDIPRSCLTRWKKAHLEKMDTGEVAVGLKPSELAAENDRLRRELAYVTEQRDILKKTIRIFGEENPSGRRR